MTRKRNTSTGRIISRKRKADFFNNLELYMNEYKRKFLTVRETRESPAAVTRAS